MFILCQENKISYNLYVCKDFNSILSADERKNLETGARSEDFHPFNQFIKYFSFIEQTFLKTHFMCFCGYGCSSSKLEGVIGVEFTLSKLYVICVTSKIFRPLTNFLYMDEENCAQKFFHGEVFG